ncbi:MAG: ATP-binding cassette domain-containing protein, partial [bacterium]|nr:ATP-binding cassette domain-containing protein [bacterium]
MSEEILKALMQLFAIITKQDEGASAKEKLFVETFLKQQLNAEMVSSYLELYQGFLGEGQQEGAEEETKKRKLTSVKDSVKTLSICKKINKTLTQKQKIIVLIRLFELIDSNTASDESSSINQRREIINTVATVFNIEAEEFKNIEIFCQEERLSSLIENPDILLVNETLVPVENGAKIINTEITGTLGLLRIPSEDMYFLRYLGKDIIILNGLPINKSQINLFAYGSTIKFPHGEPIYYSDIHAQFLASADIAKISFEAEGISFKFPNGTVGLKEINISEGPGKLIAIMGGSGAGKTTLLNVLAGLELPSDGIIKINSLDVSREKKKVEGVIGYVAQDDILFEELTVYQNLYFNAKLCFADYSEQELEDAVTKTLKSLGLYDIREIKVGNVLNKKISGGQRKRLNISLELIREPSILFLDEPTSGLSSRDSENVIDLLKELTLKGKLIFVVIHQPSSDIYKMFDKVIILDVGGYQIYNGNPVQAVTYFKKLTDQINAEEGQCPHCGNVNPEQVFNTIDAKVVNEYGNLTELRKVSPKIWRHYFQEHVKIEKAEQINEAPPKSLNLPGFFTQLFVFTKRDVLSKLSNTQYLLINLLEAPLLAFILSFIIRYTDDPQGGYFYGNNENIPAFIFMSIIVALFMGLTVSAEEIIRDAKILKREKFLNLSRLGYISSKIIILFTLSAIQTLLFTVIGNAILGIHEMNMMYWIMLFTLSCTANVIGLNISATFNSAVTIYILIPILLIHQMVLCGAIFSFDKLNRAVGSKETVPIIADVMASRWAFEGLAVTQFKDNKFEKAFFDFEKKESEYDYKSVYWAPKMLVKLDDCKKLLSKGKLDTKENEKLSYTIQLIKNELVKELSINKKFNFDPEDIKGSFAKFDLRSVDYLKNVVTIIQDNYIAQYNDVNNRKDAVMSKFMVDNAKQELFNKTKKEFYNESLADIVKKQTAKNKILEYEGKLLQMKDPIFKDPIRHENPLNYRTHLYSPFKYFANNKYDTFWFNVTVIWIMTFGFVLT